MTVRLKTTTPSEQPTENPATVPTVTVPTVTVPTVTVPTATIPTATDPGEPTPEPTRSSLLKSIGRVNAGAPKKIEDTEPPALLAYLSRTVLEEDFLRFLPPAEKRRFFSGIKSAIGGAWGSLKDLWGWIKTKVSRDPERVMLAAERAREKAMQLPHHDEPEWFTKDELRVLKDLIEGPIAELARARKGGPPATLEELFAMLQEKGAKKQLIALRMKHGGVGELEAEEDVDVAIAVAKAIVEQSKHHLEVAVADKRVLDASGKRLDPKKVKELPAALRLVLEDRSLGPQALAVIKEGGAVSSQVLRQTPEHMIEDLRTVSSELTAGTYLWVDEYVKTGKRPQITRADLEKKKAAFETVGDELEKRVDEVRTKLEAKANDEDRRKIQAAFSITDRETKLEAIQALGTSLSSEPLRASFVRLAGGYRAAQTIRTRDPEQALNAAEQKLDQFDDFRSQAVRVRVHGGSAKARGLEGRLRNDPRLSNYSQRILNATVGYDYAHEASKSAARIVKSIAVLALLGQPIKDLLGEGIMESVIATSEDVAGLLGEWASLRAQDVKWKDLLWGWRNAGLLPTLGVAMYVSSLAEHALSKGLGALAGVELAFGSTALTLYTTFSSWVLFRSAALDMAKNGKLDPASFVPTARSMIGATARRALDLIGKVDEPVTPELVVEIEAAFDRAAKVNQGVPVGRVIAQAMEVRGTSLSPELREAIASAHDEVMSLIRSGRDVDAEMTELAERSGETIIAMAKDAGMEMDPERAVAVTQQVQRAISELEGLGPNNPERIGDVVEKVLLAVAAQGGAVAIDEKTRVAIKRAADGARTQASDLEADISEDLSPEMKKMAHQFAKDQIFANPVRLRLFIGVAIGATLSVATGVAAPALLHIPFTIAFLGSMESIFTAGTMMASKIMHRRELRNIGEEFADKAATQRAHEDEIAKSIAPFSGF